MSRERDFGKTRCLRSGHRIGNSVEPLESRGFLLLGWAERPHFAKYGWCQEEEMTGVVVASFYLTGGQNKKKF